MRVSTLIVVVPAIAIAAAGTKGGGGGAGTDHSRGVSVFSRRESSRLGRPGTPTL